MLTRQSLPRSASTFQTGYSNIHSTDAVLSWNTGEGPIYVGRRKLLNKVLNMKYNLTVRHFPATIVAVEK